jgi:hypothetical protein
VGLAGKGRTTYLALPNNARCAFNLSFCASSASCLPAAARDAFFALSRCFFVISTEFDNPGMERGARFEILNEEEEEILSFTAASVDGDELISAFAGLSQERRADSWVWQPPMRLQQHYLHHKHCCPCLPRRAIPH